MSDLSVRELPDVEGLLIRVLGADVDLRNAGLRGVHGPAFPRKANLEWPLMRIHRSGGPAEFAPWLDAGRYVVEVFGKDTVQIRTIMTKAYAILVRLPGVHDEGIVSAVRETIGRAFIPAQDTDMPRYLCEVEVRAHPNP